ncbi:MAG: zinc ribbon domain-containing protein [Candidatus Lokiarchaeota archaeon]|nr:zinc ribbon domain-containing protein [Candidatus Lokiarchaeota archaeon]
MGYKYFYFIKSLPIEEIYEKTLTFWTENKGNIEEESLSSDKLIKTLKIHRGMTLTSNGEDYTIDFSYNLRESNTYIRIEASLVLGYGIQWLTPKKLINKWVSELRINPTYLVGITNKDFFNFEINPRRRPRYVEESKPKFSPKVESRPITTLHTQPSVTPRPSMTPQSTYQPSKPTPVSNEDKFTARFCTFCGTEGRKSYHFCKNCGSKFE